MTVPNKYRNVHVPVRLFLASYRAFSDGRQATVRLRECLEEGSLLVDWKVNWAAACTLLRSSIALFQHDAKICVSAALRDSIQEEWRLIARERGEHPIFWEFLKKERDNILKEYKWSAYELYFDKTGQRLTRAPSIFDLVDRELKRELVIMSGYFKDRSALETIEAAASWVLERIEAAIARAGLDPDEYRNLVTFAVRPPSPPGLLSVLSEPR